MILFISDGRLGNQLFQYAFLNTIAQKGEKIIAINMKQFTDTCEIINQNFKPLYIGKYSLFILKKLLKPFILMSLIKLKILGYIKQNENETGVQSSFSEKKGLLPIRLVETNFFQSEKFFDKAKIDFTIRQKYSDVAKDFLNQVPLESSKIFVHVRRGDYIFEPYLGERGIDLPKSYFEKAMYEMAQNVENPFFIFLSDDFTFVECCFENIKNKIISKNSMGIDLAIMSQCEYGIVSNSSFSWWGAYMMKKRKKVIFPKYWYGWKQKIESHSDIQPDWAEIIEVNE